MNTEHREKSVKKPVYSPLRSIREEKPLSPLRARIHEIIYEADTPAGKAFDVALLVMIILSVTAVVLDSVAEYHNRFGLYFQIAEWSFTILFSLEYAVRLYSVRQPHRYALSFFGLVDLLAVVPTYLSLFIAGTQTLLVLRVLRLLRVFRVFKLARYLGEANVLREAMTASRHKITVFLGAVLSAVLIIGTLMQLIEGAENGFTSIPRSVYWAIVTMTTVGYGDIAPATPLGQTLAAFVMILGYAIIAVPTGIVSVEIAQASRKQNVSTRSCSNCTLDGHDADAVHCKRCGAVL